MEVELKLEIAPDDAAAALASPLFAGREATTERLETVYFDTADAALRAAGLSLRVRHAGDRRIQTIKADPVAAGLFVRREWECDIDGDEPRLDLAAGVPLPDLSQPLEPWFRTFTERQTVTVATGAAEFEVVIDRGEIDADGRVEPICEIEIELRRGAPAAAFELARELEAVVPVRLGVLSKSERGYRLRDGRRRPAKAEAVALTADQSTETAFAAVAASCLRQYRLNEALLLAGGRDAGALHQARVGLRRLRSALSLFGEVVADARYDDMKAGFRWLAGLLGEARDLDVLIEKASEPDVLGRLTAARDAAYDRVEAALASARVRGLLLDFAEWTAVGAWRSDPGLAAARTQPAADFAEATLGRLRRRIRRRGHHLARLDDEARHRVRITGKKLRYAVDFFAALYRPKPLKRFLKPLERVQDRLGQLNDEAAGRAMLDRLGIEQPEANFPRKRRRKLLREAAQAHDALVEARRFW